MLRFIFIFLLAVNSFIAVGQIEFGVKTGLSSYDLAKDGILIHQGDQDIKWNINNSGYGHHFGIYTRLSLLGIFIEPSLLFNSNKVDYNISTYGESGVVNTVKTEKYNHMDIPVLLGLKLGVLRFQGGIVGHLFINSISEVVDVKGYEQKFKQGRDGWQAGTGLDIWKLRLDLMYEGNLNKFGDHINVGGQSYAFTSSPSRLLLTAGFKF